jgi:tetrahydromethanopterin S-methyltransferase subunit B
MYSIAAKLVTGNTDMRHRRAAASGSVRVNWTVFYGPVVGLTLVTLIALILTITRRFR